jgi:hypothetical protein
MRVKTNQPIYFQGKLAVSRSTMGCVTVTSEEASRKGRVSVTFDERQDGSIGAIAVRPATCEVIPESEEATRKDAGSDDGDGMNSASSYSDTEGEGDEESQATEASEICGDAPEEPDSPSSEGKPAEDGKRQVKEMFIGSK